MAFEIGEARQDDLPAILDIYNQAIRDTTAAWTYAEIDLDNRTAWLAEKAAKALPVLVARQGGAVLGFASYGPFRAWDGYLHTVENSVYVRADGRRRGVGRRLMAALIDRARGQGLHVMVAAIEAENLASIRMHAALGFFEAGRLPQAGAKFGRWLDLVLMQLTLETRDRPPG